MTSTRRTPGAQAGKPRTSSTTSYSFRAGTGTKRLAPRIPFLVLFRIVALTLRFYITARRVPGSIILLMAHHPTEDHGWLTLGSEYLYRNPWCAFRVDEVRLPDGAEIEYGILESGGFAAVVPITDEGRVVLVRQWRQPLGDFTLELPSGGVDDGEEPEAAARRELFEETGYRAEGLAHLVSVHTSTGRSTEVCHLFRCRAVRDERGPRPEQTEFIRVVEMPFAEAARKAVKGGIADASTVLGILWPADG
jgi:ADP-ribose pyrophosphatase